MARNINLSVGEQIVDPDFDDIASSARDIIKKGTLLISALPIYKPAH